MDPVTVGGIGNTSGSVAFANPFGTTTIFTIVVTKVSTQAVINTITLTSPGTAIDENLGTLEVDTQYSVVVTTEIDTYSQTADAVLFTTTNN